MIAKSLYIYAFAAIFLSYNNAVSSLIYRRTPALKKPTIVGRTQHTRDTSSPLIKYQEKLMALRAGYVEDLAISVMVIGESLLWLKIWTYCAEKKFLEPNLTRKIIHTGSAPLFIFHWPLYSSLLYSKFIAAAIPLIQIIRYNTILSNVSSFRSNLDLNYYYSGYIGPEPPILLKVLERKAS